MSDLIPDKSYDTEIRTVRGGGTSPLVGVLQLIRWDKEDSILLQSSTFRKRSEQFEARRVQ